jgi:hypothetical protein
MVRYVPLALVAPWKWLCLAMLLTKHANMLTIIQIFVLAFGKVNLKPTQFALQKIRIHGSRSLAKDEMNRRRHDLLCTKVHHWKLKTLVKLWFSNKVIMFQEPLEY